MNKPISGFVLYFIRNMYKPYFIRIREGKKKIFVPSYETVMEIFQKYYGLSEDQIFNTHDDGEETVMSNGSTTIHVSCYRYDAMIDCVSHGDKAHRQALKRFYTNQLKYFTVEDSGFHLLAHMGRIEACELLNTI
jgi:hypothetical protein